MGRKLINDKVQLQWNKMYGMNLDIDEPYRSYGY